MRTLHPLVYIGAHRGNGLAAELSRNGARYDRAIAFEPHPGAFAELSQRFRERVFHHDGRPIVIELHEEAAIVERNIDRVKLNLYGGDAGGSSSLGAMNAAARARIESHWPSGFLERKGTIWVRARNVAEWLLETGVHHISALVLDVQGMDLAIAKTFTPWLMAGRIGELQAEVDQDGLPHYEGLPDNSLAAWREFMRPMVLYEHKSGPIEGWTDPKEIQADIRWKRRPIA